jgi:ribosome-associated toxin RatA of RatAB toxin-antitoxin module
MQTVDEIIIRAEPEAVYRAAADILEWPRLLPHYRRVKALAHVADGLQVEMAAWRGWIPVRWTAVQRLDPTRRRVYYRHTGGATRGMMVMWEITPVAGGARVVIVHELALEVPLVRTRLGKSIVGHGFVHHIAGRTLRALKKHLEGTACAEQSSPASGR